MSAERVSEYCFIVRAVCAIPLPRAGPFFRFSFIDPYGVDELGASARCAQAVGPSHRRRFRMAIDRAFTFRLGTIVTGTVHAGEIRVGESVSVGPTAHGLLTARVRTIHAQDRASVVGVAGQRCALNLAGVEKAQVERGMWVQAPALMNFTERFDATLTLSPRVAKSLGSSSTVHLHHGTADAMAKVTVLDATRIEPAESQLVSLNVDRPLAVCRGDRFVIRDASAQQTLGGGSVLDVIPLGSAHPRPARSGTSAIVGSAARRCAGRCFARVA